jgi:hypothetical protein
MIELTATMKWLPFFFIIVGLLFAQAEKPKPKPVITTPNIVKSVPVETQNIVLSYDEQLDVLDPANAWVKVTTAVIDMPAEVHRGQIIPVTVNIPTIVRDVSGVTVVIGYMSSELQSTVPGIYTGRMEVSETNERGVNRVQYYFRSSQGKIASVEKLIRVN